MSLHFGNVAVDCSRHGCMFRSHGADGYTDVMMGWMDIAIRVLIVLVFVALVIAFGRWIARRGRTEPT